MTARDLRDQATDRLIQNDRIIVEARMLPKNRKLTRREVDAVRGRLRKLMATTKESGDPVTLTRVANEVDYGTSTMSQWLDNKYKGKVDRVTHAVNLWIEREARRRVGKSTREYVTTWVCELMMAIARAAHRRERMAAIVAPSGSGKDMVIRYLAEELNGHIVNCHAKMSSTVLVRTIATRLGVSDRRCTCAELMEKVCKLIDNKNCVLFLNEAQNLPSDAAGIIRAIHDETGVPILMFGSAGIFDFIDDRASGGGQFHRRCMKLNVVDRMARESDPDDPTSMDRPLYSVAEVRDFVRMKQVKLADDEVLAMIWSIANLIDRGTMGFANAIVEGIVDTWGRDTVITPDHVVAQLLDESADEADDILAEAEQIERPATLKQRTA